MCAISRRILYEVIEDTNRRFWGCACLGICVLYIVYQIRLLLRAVACACSFDDASRKLLVSDSISLKAQGVMLPITLAFFGFYSLSSILHEAVG